MWQIYHLLRTAIRQIHALTGTRQSYLQAQRICYEKACELEKIQCWYDNRTHAWKQTPIGRLLARLLYRTHCTISEAESQF